MSDDNEQTLKDKRSEVIRSLVSATENERLIWEQTGDGGYYAQPNSMGVRINRHRLNSEKFWYELRIFKSNGDQVDLITTIYGENFFNGLAQLWLSIREYEDNLVARDLDNFLEDLRA